MNIAERLALFIQYLDISAQEFENKCQISGGTASRITSKSYPKTFGRIAMAYPQLNIDWLKTGEGEMLKGDASNARMLGGVYATTQGDDGVVMVDYVSGAATATFIEYMGDGNPELDKIAVLKQYGENLDKSYKVFEVIGESMSPRIPNRAKILTKEVPVSKWGLAEGVVVVVFGDEVVVKRIINNDLVTHNSLVLSSDNPLYGERQIALADIRAIYKAIRIVSADIM